MSEDIDVFGDKIERLPLLRLDTVVPRPVEWHIPGVLARGKVTTLDGEPGVGKGHFHADLTARITTGGDWIDGNPCPQGDVIIVTVEDAADDTLVPRLLAAGADLTRVHHVSLVPEGEERRPFQFPNDTELLVRMIDQTGALLVIIDPLFAHLAPGVDSYKDQSIRGALAPLSEALQRAGASCLLVRHLTKQEGRKAINRGGGSIGLIGLARTGFLLAKDPRDPDVRVFAPIKSNIGKMPNAYAFRIKRRAFDDVAHVEWATESVPFDADQLVCGGAHSQPARDNAREFLLDNLSDGPVPMAVLEGWAEQEGLSKRTLERARRELTNSGKSGFGADAFHYVWLKEQGDPTPNAIEKARQAHQRHAQTPPTSARATAKDAASKNMAVFGPTAHKGRFETAPLADFGHQPANVRQVPVSDGVWAPGQRVRNKFEVDRAGVILHENAAATAAEGRLMYTVRIDGSDTELSWPATCLVPAA